MTTSLQMLGGSYRPLRSLGRIGCHLLLEQRLRRFFVVFGQARVASFNEVCITCIIEASHFLIFLRQVSTLRTKTQMQSWCLRGFSVSFTNSRC